jgi:hypothetical protein
MKILQYLNQKFLPNKQGLSWGFWMKNKNLMNADVPTEEKYQIGHKLGQMIHHKLSHEPIITGIEQNRETYDAALFMK